VLRTPCGRQPTTAQQWCRPWKLSDLCGCLIGAGPVLQAPCGKDNRPQHNNWSPPVTFGLMGAGEGLCCRLLWRKTNRLRRSGAPPLEQLTCGCLIGAGPVLQAPVEKKDIDHGATVVRRPWNSDLCGCLGGGRGLCCMLLWKNYRPQQWCAIWDSD
jgi:hypothetical protein